MDPLLPVIVPFFNSAGKADRLLSTLARINEPDIELIFVDDGSTDGTGVYLRDWQARMQVRCTAVRQENKGPGAARNHGLNLASGQFVWYVDADDDINPDVIPGRGVHHAVCRTQRSAVLRSAHHIGVRRDDNAALSVRR